MDNNRNFLIAAALSLAVIVLWTQFVINPRVERERKAAEIEAARTQPTPKAGDKSVQAEGMPQPSSGQGTSVPGQAPDQDAQQSDAQKNVGRVELSSDRLKGSINLLGGRIDDLHLTRYHEKVNPQSPTIYLLKPQGNPDAYLAEFGWARNDKAGAMPGPTTVWKQVSGDTLSPGSPVVLEYVNDKGLTFRRHISLDDDYMFTVKQTVLNSNDSAFDLRPYGRIMRFGEPKVEGIYVLHEGLIGSVGDQGLDEMSYDDMKEDSRITRDAADKGWVGITDKYWATALVPGERFTASYNYYKTKNPFFQSDFLGEPVAVPAGGEVSVTNRLFAGAKKVDILDKYETDLDIPNFSNLIDWGWFYFLTKPLFKLLNWVYHGVGNFGVAILIVTVLIKLLFFPLANKSYASMANMKKVQPEMEAIKNRYADDRPAQQKAMMELYRKEKINPAAGCWPMLIQIPVFFALYKVIYVTIEMRHAPFFGWIKDLSAPDPTSIFNLFGLLPFDPPSLLMIGVWPILMGITMFVQMQMNPAPQDPTQAMIFRWMPLVFTMMLASFPAGLVIYWTWNNFLSILQQAAIMKRQGVKIELFDNLKSLVQKKPASEESGGGSG